jgi:predicted nucleic acid-binding Zn ribbon protein
MTEKKRSLTSLKEIVKEILKDGTVPFNPEDMEIWRVWDEVVGPVVSRHAQPAWFDKGCLRVMVSDPIWLQELRFSVDEIKKGLNSKLGRGAVKHIDIRVGSE